MPVVTRAPSGALLLLRPETGRFARPEPLPPDAPDAAISPTVDSPPPSTHGAAPAPVPPTRAVGAPAPPTPVAVPSRLEELGRMTASVAHDFNNVLSVIMVCASEIAAEATDPEQAERAGEIRAAAERGAELSRMLLSRDRPAASPPTPLDVDAAIVEAMPRLRRTAGNGIEIALTSGGHLPHVMLAPGELERMLVNLAANARDAMPDGGTITIATALVSIPPSDPWLNTGWCVRIAVSDTGSGMDPQVACNALRPGFSTKSRAAGAGLGLATVHSLIRSRSGDLRINTAPGSGSALSMLLPAVRASGAALSL